MKILISDPMDQSARQYLTGNGILIDYKPEISASDLIASISQYEGLLVRSRTKVSKEIIDKGVKLKIIGRIGSGYDNIDIETCQRRKITVVNSPDVNSVAVAEMTVGLLISMWRDIPKAVQSMRNGHWIKNEIWGREIAGKTVGIVGYGHIGSKVEKLFRAFGAKTLVYSRTYKTAGLKEIFRRSDIVTLHLSLTEQTIKMVNCELLSLMKPTAVLVNMARGQIVDEEALYQTLLEKKIRGAILDVYWTEPLPPRSKWRKLDNVLLTPHIAAATAEAFAKASMSVGEDIVRFSQGEKVKNKVV